MSSGRLRGTRPFCSNQCGVSHPPVQSSSYIVDGLGGCLGPIEYCVKSSRTRVHYTSTHAYEYCTGEYEYLRP